MSGIRSCRLAGTLLFGVVVFSSLLGGCSRTPTLRSHRTGTPITVDGSDTDWGAGRYVLEDTPLTLGLANDDDYLYVSLATADRAIQMQVVTRGVELWLDPEGGKESYFGVRLPQADADALRAGRSKAADNGGGSRGARGSASPERMAELFAAFVDQREVYVLDSPKDEGWKTTAGSGDPLQLRVQYGQNRLVLEARIPLEYVGHPSYRIQASEGTYLGLGVNVPEPERPSRGSSMGRSGSGGRGGMGGKGGGMRGGGMRGGRGGGGTRGSGTGERAPESLEQWVRVSLAG